MPTSWCGQDAAGHGDDAGRRVPAVARPSRRVERRHGEVIERFADLEAALARIAVKGRPHAARQALRRRPRRTPRPSAAWNVRVADSDPVQYRLTSAGRDLPRHDGCSGGAGRRKHRCYREQDGVVAGGARFVASNERTAKRAPRRPELPFRRPPCRADGPHPRHFPHDADSRRAPHHHPRRPQAPRLRPARSTRRCSTSASRSRCRRRPPRTASRGTSWSSPTPR